jgi:predicted DNA-binding transcriptional regulator YafY
MNFIERKKRLDYLLEMIEKGQCISTNQLAVKFDCSTRTVERMINELRNEGIKIKYCSTSKKYRINLSK